MSDFAQLGVIGALAVANVWLYFYMDNSIERRADGIVTAVIRGVPVSIKHRRMLLHLRWFGGMAIVVGYSGLTTTALVLIARSARSEEVALLAYLFAWFAFFAVFGSLGHGTLGDLHLRSVLQEAEAD